MLVIGSSAMAWNGLVRPNQKVVDIDCIAYPEEKDMFWDCERIEEKPHKTVYKNSEGTYFEIEWAYPNTNQEKLLKLLDHNLDYGFEYAPKEVLYALKMSHRFLKNSPHFLKTMCDIHTMRSRWRFMGIAPYLKEWYDWRVNDTYTYPHPKLNQGKSSFFDQNIFDGKQVYVYDHDSLHEAVKIYDKPAYTAFIDGEVKVSQDKFNKQPYDIKLASVVEESCVLALERAMIPHGTSQDRAFMIALEKVCTSISSGWWRDFAWNNYLNALRCYEESNIDLKKCLQQGLDRGIVKPFKQ